MTTDTGAGDTAPEPDHIVIINRYPAAFARYQEYIDHSRSAVSYVSRLDVAATAPDNALDVIAVNTSGDLVNTEDDCRRISDALATLIARHGRPAALVALFEGDLDIAARLRERHDIPGDRPADVAPFRDKFLMHERAIAGGVPTPATGQVTSTRSVLDFGAAHGWPLVVKPRHGTGSTGVRRYDDPAAAAELSAWPGDDLIVQPFVAGPVLHADGVYGGTALVSWRLSRYIGDCLSYNASEPLASYELDDTERTALVGALLERLLATMSARPVVFHAEFIESPDGSLTFLEIAGRPGGAEVHRVWREVHGIDLLALHTRFQMGMDLDTAAGDRELSAGAERAGWLLVQPAVDRPCVVDFAGGAPDGAAYAEDVPAPGSLIHAGGGYSHAARFRFRGLTSAAVRTAVTAVAAGFHLDCRSVPEDRLVLVGSAGRPYREFSMQALVDLARISLFDRRQPTWQSAYCDTVDRFDDPANLTADIKARLTALGSPARVGVLTWDESLVEEAASVAASLGVPGIGVAAVQNCRDKLRTREALDSAPGLAVRYRVAESADEARAAAAAVGYPVVLKPRALAGSAGVVKVDDPRELTEAFRMSQGTSFPGLPRLDGVLVEEYLPGPEISVDAVVAGGVATCVNVARKRVGFAPSFEEVGHVVRPWRDEPWAPELQRMMQAVHEALGVGQGVTHGEVRLTPGGPRLVELNCRLGGDFIPLLGRLATGIDLVRCAAELALGREPAIRPVRDRVAEVRFLYPPEDCVVERIDLDRCREVPRIEVAVRLAEPGMVLRLPPRGAVGRFAALIAVGDNEEQTSEALSRAAGLALFTGGPVDE